MPLPFYTRPSPAPAPAPRPGVPASPAHTWSSKPSLRPGQVQKPVLQKPVFQRGFLEKGGFRQHDELIHEVKKDSYYKSIPNLGKKFTQTERMSLVKELERAGKGMGGLTGEKLGVAIKKLEKEKMAATSHWQFGKAKVLDQKIKQAQVWKKAWDRRKI